MGHGSFGDGGFRAVGAPVAQHGFAQSFGIAFAVFRKLDDLLSDDIVGNVAAINAPKRLSSHRQDP